ncbi:UbiA family prenyltransferase [Curtobacterium sp. MCJR17_043]|uniref:UbiA family prenyltransferase n=1 Tax=Curtobacterium sp. MCJR17_043 TaxID=2175660 RepID=UPI0032E89A41
MSGCRAQHRRRSARPCADWSTSRAPCSGSTPSAPGSSPCGSPARCSTCGHCRSSCGSPCRSTCSSTASTTSTTRTRTRPTPRKGSIEGARIRQSEVRLIAWAVAVVNVPFLVGFLLTLPLLANAAILLYVGVFVFYSAPPLRFKARPFLDSLSNAAYALPLVIVPAALAVTPVWPAAIGLMAWSVAKHAFDAVQDIVEDRDAGIATTAVRLGARGTALWSGAWWIVSTALFAVVSVPVAAVNLLIAGILVVRLFRDPTPETGHRLYRLSVAFPYIAGSFAGVLLMVWIVLGGAS